MKRNLLLVLMLAFLLTACSCGGTDVTDSPEPEVDLEAAETLLESDPLYRLILSSSFSSPSGLKLDPADAIFCLMLEQGESKAVGVLSSEVKEELKKSFPEADINTSFLRISAEAVKQAVERCLGTLPDGWEKTELAEIVYCAADGYYYAVLDADALELEVSAWQYDPIEVDTVVLMEDGTVEVWYHPQGRPNTFGRAVVSETEEVWVICSNQIESAVDPVETPAPETDGPEDILTDDLLALWNEIARDGSWYLWGLFSDYETPEQLDLYTLCRSMERPVGYTEAEKEFLKEAWNAEETYDPETGESWSIWYSYEKDSINNVIRVPAVELDSALQKYYGITLQEAQGKDGLTYCEATNCYYFVSSDAGFTAESIELDRGEYVGQDEVRFCYLCWGGECTVTLKNNDGQWQIVSNLFTGKSLW